jgi:2-dehydro-3-deoxyphosphogluconate aldolase/(4S)-4-hydroxy-2-oxoglutarate aldolase
MRDPLPHVRFFPTGGVTLDDTPAYLVAGAIAVGVATALASPAAIAAGNDAVLEASARRWVELLAMGPFTAI